MSCKISVITVCKNCRDYIGSTIDSVLAQDYRDMEYLIVDGDSSDGTLDIICEKASKDDRIRYISESDNGIYDAMNKAARIATGEYLQFINAGDMLYKSNTISTVVRIAESHKGDIFFGDSYFDNYEDGMISSSLRRYPQYCSWGVYFCTGDCINHQSIIASHDCFDVNTFDTAYKVGADRDWMIRMKKRGMKWVSINFPVVRYRIDKDSFSVKYQEEFLGEVREQTRIYYPVFGELIWRFVTSVRKGNVTSKLLHFLSSRTIFKQ